MMGTAIARRPIAADVVLSTRRKLPHATVVESCSHALTPLRTRPLKSVRDSGASGPVLRSNRCSKYVFASRRNRDLYSSCILTFTLRSSWHQVPSRLFPPGLHMGSVSNSGPHQRAPSLGETNPAAALGAFRSQTVFEFHSRHRG